MKHVKKVIDFLEDEIGDMPAFKYEVLDVNEIDQQEEHYTVIIETVNDFESNADKKWHLSFMHDGDDLWVKLGEDYKPVSQHNFTIRHFWMALLF